MEICTLHQLYHYTLRALGSPVINIAIDDTQAEDRLNDVIEQFCLRHYNATEEKHLPCYITAEIAAVQMIQLPSEIVSVTEVLNANNSGASGEEFERLNFLLKDTEIFEQLSTGLSNYYISRRNLATMNDILNPARGHTYNAITGRLNYNGELKEGQWIFINCYVCISPEEFPNIYNNEWVKKAAIQHMKKQWGTNLKKFSGIQLAGGLELNGQLIYDEAVAEIEKLDAEYSLKYEYPVDMFIG